ncbi:tryptophan 7-halogenase [Catenovulum sp. 2E275]|uniref:tryptophan halogenase family protein n=1 Tax=Catenovulum sp. 2E275 TaxID=2980497 RepID=UPI0021D2770A|nr:tryptophan halogenase family protein [Catenovulum sp. 2E275]MCU4674103.1 tryptophan 7-halogenase [Catenovulum sp. 2E275]
MQQNNHPNTNEKLKNIVIAGGGTAGWMTAAAFGKLFGNSLNIKLIESEQIGTVGVGEATIPTLIYYHRLLGLDEREVMAATQATFKLGIQFENWRAINKDYFHAFGRTGQDCWACGFQHFWLKGQRQGITHSFADYNLELQAALNNKFAHLPDNSLGYAFHLDATLYAKYLRQFAEQHGVKRIEGKIDKIHQHPQTGYIESLTLDNQLTLNGDLFIDCTGMRALLIEQTLNTGFEDWSHWLPADSALAVQTQLTGQAKPYTRSIAHSFGWQWNIPLQHRAGNGLVYSSKFVDDGTAEQTLKQNLHGEQLTDIRKINFKTGKRRQQWHKNCVAIGLSSGFLEPLESTSIHLISASIIRLMQMLPLNGIETRNIHEFNKQAELELIGIRDFIILHYKVTDRRDSPFWRHCANMPIPDTLNDKIQLFKESGRVLRERDELFEDSWQQVMLGQGLTPQHYHPIADNMTETELNQFLTNIRHNIQKTVSRMPEHKTYIERYCQSQ